ncbi:MAG: HD domain-containing protein [Nanoarchaeota archaeon]|nr:HD domain-containing protein [Nanoarchaeota archaeon]
MEEKNNLKIVRKAVYNLFLDKTDERKFSYVRRDWIFPNHLDIMLSLVDDMIKKYGGDEEICKLGVLLHDTGLVYGRDSADPTGHENRSIEYAKKIFETIKLSESKREKIIECIEATDAKEEPENLNAKIVRTADALSQFVSIHFFAKSAFSGDWNNFHKWLRKKATNNFKKICFDDEKKIALPVRDYILNAFELYEKYNKRYLH